MTTVWTVQVAMSPLACELLGWNSHCAVPGAFHQLLIPIFCILKAPVDLEWSPVPPHLMLAYVHARLLSHSRLITALPARPSFLNMTGGRQGLSLECFLAHGCRSAQGRIDHYFKETSARPCSNFSFSRKVVRSQVRHFLSSYIGMCRVHSAWTRNIVISTAFEIFLRFITLG